MDWSPDNKNRCDNQLCRYATICNLITLFLILIFITGLAQASVSPDRMAVDFHPHNILHNDVQVSNRDKITSFCPACKY